MESSEFNDAAWNPLQSIGMLWAMLHKIHCIQSGCIGPRCMDSTAYKRNPLRQNAWNTLHSTTLHGIHCIQSGCFGPCCKKSTAFNHVTGIHFIQSCCIKSTTFHRVPFLHAAWNTLHSIRLHGIHCIPSGCIFPRCMDYTAINHAAWNPLHSVGMIWAMLHIIHSIQSG